MPDSDSLNVWIDQRLVGRLWQNVAGLIGFQYDESWLSNSAFVLSQSLPLQASKFEPESKLAHRFFANLLPEGLARERLVRDLKIVDTDFELLRAIGGECAGACSILNELQQPVFENSYFRLSENDLENLVASRGRVYTFGHDYRPRLSLAGAQHKCPVLIAEGEYWLPQDHSPTSHILKFELSDYRNVPAYETFTTLLARNVGLPVCDVELKTISGTNYVVIERYDRVYADQGQLMRLHQEDFCQALGQGSESKYQENTGVTFADCYRLLQSVSSDPITDLRHLLNWQVFNVLAGNSDGHAKNLSLLYHRSGEIRLAPFYDLICTRAIKHLDHRLALTVGAQKDPGVISSQHWQVMARQCELSPNFLIQLVGELAHRLLETFSSSVDEFENQYGSYPALQRIERIVIKQCRRATARVLSF